MKRFTPISAAEMETFLTDKGFQKMNLPGVTELVFGKIIRVGNLKLSLRIYTAINPNGESRECGSDAIRITLFHRFTKPVAGPDQIEIIPVNSMKCLRTKNWRTNMSNAIDKVQKIKVCPKCGNPMVEREGQYGKFWGCTTWKYTQCPGR